MAFELQKTKISLISQIFNCVTTERTFLAVHKNRDISPSRANSQDNHDNSSNSNYTIKHYHCHYSARL